MIIKFIQDENTLSSISTATYRFETQNNALHITSISLYLGCTSSTGGTFALEFGSNVSHPMYRQSFSDVADMQLYTIPVDIRVSARQLFTILVSVDDGARVYGSRDYSNNEYLSYTGTYCPGIVFEADVVDNWIIDSDGYGRPALLPDLDFFTHYVPPSPWFGWKLDDQNDGYPYLWLLDTSVPIITSNIYMVTNNGGKPIILHQINNGVARKIQMYFSP